MPGLKDLLGRAGGWLRGFEARTVSAGAVGTSLLSWQTGPRIGTEGLLEGYGTMPWLRANLQKVSEDVAGLTWEVYRINDRAGKAIRHTALQHSRSPKIRRSMIQKLLDEGRAEPIPNHPILDLMTSGNQYFGAHSSMQVTQAHIDLVGEFAWLLDLNAAGMPVVAVPIPPTWVAEMPTGGTNYYRVVGPTGTWIVPRANMLFGYHPHPKNPFYRGTGISHVMGDELETDEYAAKYTKDWFKNRGIPPVLISGLDLALPELQRLEEKWLAKYAKKGSGWLPHFLSKKVEVHQLSPSFQQQELGSLRDRERDMIRQVIGIPPEIMGDVSNSNRSTIDASDFIYQSRVIVPRGEFLRSWFQQLLVPRFDERLFLDYCSPVGEDKEFKLKVMQAMPFAFMIDEFRKFGGEDELPAGAGKVFMVPINLLPSRTFISAPKPAAPAGPGGAPALPPGPGAPALPPAPGTPTPPPPTVPPAGQSLRRKDWIDDLEDDIDDAGMAAALVPILRAAMAAWGQETIDEAVTGLSIKFDLSDPRVAAYLHHFAAEKITRINEVTRERVRTALEEGFAARETFDDISGRVSAVVEDDARADLIAQTELTPAVNAAAEMALRQAGFGSKEWLSTEDDRVRDTHIDLDGTIVDIDEDFVSSSGAAGPYPGAMGDPAEDCNCRCQLIAVLAERSLEARTAQWVVKDAARRPYEGRLAKAIRDVFAEQAAAVLAALGKRMGTGKMVLVR